MNIRRIGNAERCMLERKKCEKQKIDDKPNINCKLHKGMTYEIVDQKLTQPTLIDFGNNLNQLNQLINYQMIVENPGDEENPTIRFRDSLNSGFYLKDNLYIALTINGRTKIVYNEDNTEFTNPLLLNDICGCVSVNNLNQGLLYKRKNKSGLYWKTLNKEVDLVKIYSVVDVNEKLNVSIPINTNSIYLKNSHMENDDSHLNFFVNNNNIISVNDNNLIIRKNKKIQFESDINHPIDLSFDSNNNLCTKQNQLNKTYVSSDVFLCNGNINEGDVVGICDDGRISSVLGYKWDNKYKFDQDIKTLLFNDETNKLLYIEQVDLQIKINVSNISDNKLSNTKNILIQNNTNDTAELVIKLVKLDTNNYILAYGTYQDMSNITLVKFDVDENNNINIIDELIYQTNSIETFDLVYENSGSLDILVLVMFSTENYNLECCLFSVSTNKIISGYYSNDFNSQVIVNNNKTLKLLLLPGQVVVISYANTKLFILLSSTYLDAFNSGDAVVDNDSYDCIDLIYDISNTVILSIERTFSDMVFIQVLDIYGTKIDILKTKYLSSSTIIPLGFGYNSITENFMIFYRDLNQDLKVQLFYHNGETIQLGLCYLCNLDINKNVNINENKKQLIYLNNNKQTIWLNNIILDFNDNVGIQPSAYIGIAKNSANDSSPVEVCYKGQIYYSDILLPNWYIGKKIYLNSNNLNLAYPNNLTNLSNGNVFIGTCVHKNRILVGL